MIERWAARALLLNRQGELLLIKIIDPATRNTFWMTPGGGLDPSESPAEALRRELFEETGLTQFELGPEVWRRDHHFTWGGHAIFQHEGFYLIQLERFEPTFHHLPDEGERTAFCNFRWWPVAEIQASSELFSPHRLGKLLKALLEQGVPAEPLVLGE